MATMKNLKNAIVRVYLYVRVSTPEQAEKDLSLPAQLDALRKYAADKGYTIVEEFVEPGVSATDDNRRVFQRMIVGALATPRPVDIILVFATSRFMRNVDRARFHKAKLKKHGVRVVAIKQETGDDATGHLMEGIFELFDQYESEVNGMRTSAAMAEAARRGYFPGSRAPFGFALKPVEISSEVIRNVLVPDQAERDLTNDVFRAYVAHGGKSAARDLNKRGLRYRNAVPFTVDLVSKIVQEEAAIGTYYWGGHNHRADDAVPREDQIAIPCEAIVDRDLWELAQQMRQARRPDRSPGRTASSPLLLAGRAHCGTCGASYQLETSGKIRNKERPYRYYNCRSFVRSGRETCPGHRIPAQRLELAVLEHLAQRLFTADRCRAILKDMIDGQGLLRQRAQERRKKIDAEVRAIDGKILKWQVAFEDGTLPEAVGNARVLELTSKRADLEAERGHEPPTSPPPALLTDASIDRFQERIRAAFLSNDRSLAKQYLHALVERVDITGQHVRIQSRPDAVARLLAAPPNANHDVVVNPRSSVLTTEGTWLPNDVRSKNFVSEFILDLDAYRKRRKPAELKTPPVVLHLQLAEKLQADLDSHLAANRTELARLHRLTKPRVTQLLGLLKLHPNILSFIRSLSSGAPERLVTEKKLRALVQLDPVDQLEAARRLLVGFATFEQEPARAAYEAVMRR